MRKMLEFHTFLTLGLSENIGFRTINDPKTDNLRFMLNSEPCTIIQGGGERTGMDFIILVCSSPCFYCLSWSMHRWL